MRCLCCNNPLNDTESTRRLVSDDSFLDWCNKCYKGMEQELPTYNNVPEEAIEMVEADWETKYWEEETEMESWGDE